MPMTWLGCPSREVNVAWKIWHGTATPNESLKLTERVSVVSASWPARKAAQTLSSAPSASRSQKSRLPLAG